VLQAACQNNGISVEEEISHVIEGWEGNPKGMLQVLWERGFINTENCEDNLDPQLDQGNEEVIRVALLTFGLKR
jgi:hypothetical protein